MIYKGKSIHLVSGIVPGRTSAITAAKRRLCLGQGRGIDGLDNRYHHEWTTGRGIIERRNSS
jgi:hypothetical protein